MLTEAETTVVHANRIADLAGSSAMAYFRHLLEIELKDDESPVTQADRSVELRVRAYLDQHFPEDGILGEEFGQSDLTCDHVWSIDPIDGTRSFLSGHPLFGILLARLYKGVPTIGVIGMPVLNETVIGVRGGSAMLNGDKIRVSSQTSLDRAILYINEAEKIFVRHPQAFNRLLSAGQTRRFGYDCYPHALVAMGHVDAVVDEDLQPYDYLPLVPVIEAAGGIVTDWEGQPLSLSSGTSGVVTAATAKLHADLLHLVGA
ncbi:histidinol-phosphatase, inositol monophosphatase family [Aliiroseovarius sediminilitoris]|uniref:Histidinol-phosphatase, inositol monophosphatase family n=1 Tax=Aliiroseovarius sediminilitoris TaxID=1173584 RepID=A0A1I0MNK1_9RHOB|nr:inositol monophosphatase family protein [Aliiroseovarius sediminilitoris]SEV89424.1 histidinol-phosphatase, inositol monophosphatase family [Aliiroseovarius sediminilitoris]